MSIGTALSDVEISVGAWDAEAAPVPADGAVPPALSVGMAGENAGSYWRKNKFHRTRAALVSTVLFLSTLVMALEN